MYARVDRFSRLDTLAELQHGVLHRRQLESLGVGETTVRAQIRAERWHPVGPGVVLLQNAPPDRRQLMWLAVLDADVAVLGSHTSLELAGFRTFALEAELVHLVVPRGSKVTKLPRVQVHESRRLHPDRAVLTGGLPRTPTAQSVIDAAAWQPHPRFAATIVAAAVQQQLVGASELEAALRSVGRVRHKRFIREAVADAATGAHSASELDLARLCRQSGIAQPARQVRRRDSSGRWRYLDAEWDLGHGESVVLEVDGSQHMDAAQWQDDIRRERAVVVGRKWVLRATAFEVRHEPGFLIRDLLAFGVPRAPDLSESGGVIAQ